MKKCGARHAIVEEQKITVSCEYKAQWRRPKVDLNELASLRWNKKWSLIKLAGHFKRTKGAIYLALQRMPSDIRRRYAC